MFEVMEVKSNLVKEDWGHLDSLNSTYCNQQQFCSKLLCCILMPILMVPCTQSLPFSLLSLSLAGLVHFVALLH